MEKYNKIRYNFIDPAGIAFMRHCCVFGMFVSLSSFHRYHKFTNKIYDFYVSQAIHRDESKNSVLLKGSCGNVVDK